MSFVFESLCRGPCESHAEQSGPVRNTDCTRREEERIVLHGLAEYLEKINGPKRAYQVHTGTLQAILVVHAKVRGTFTMKMCIHEGVWGKENRVEQALKTPTERSFGLRRAREKMHRHTHAS